jgi:hypothetical protein
MRGGNTMDQLTTYVTGRGWTIAIAVIVGATPLVAPAQAGDLMSTICRNEVVSVGDRKGEVVAKCGQPLSKSQGTVSTRASQSTIKRGDGKQETDKKNVEVKQKTIKEKEETWTYIIDGSYCFFIFKEGRLARIETGRLAR